MSALEEATRKYWSMSQHLRRQPNEDAKDVVRSLVIAPTIINTTSEDERRLLSRLVS